MTKRTAMLAIAASALALTAGSAVASSQSSDQTGVCAVVGSPATSYEFIWVQSDNLATYMNNPLNIVGVTSASDCPSTVTLPVTEKRGPGVGEDTPTPTPTPSVTPSPSQAPRVLAASTEAPSQLPDTGAGLSTLIGLPTLGVATKSYLTARFKK